MQNNKPTRAYESSVGSSPTRATYPQPFSREFYERWLHNLLHPRPDEVAAFRSSLFARQPTRRWYR